LSNILDKIVASSHQQPFWRESFDEQASSAPGKRGAARGSAPTWPDEWVRALSDASLRQSSSAAIFQRGKGYASSGAVEVVNEDPMPEPALHAQVSGTETYTTEVWIEDDAVAGSCDCPNADDGWFCKHQVAVALVWRERLAGRSCCAQ
jgi:uncharacterized Zn finger protein